MIHPDYIAECLKYNPCSGVLEWQERPLKHFHSAGTQKRWNSLYAGKIAGGKGVHGYIGICVDGKMFPAHRLAYAIVMGEWPKEQIDHVNGVRDDNRWENLRAVSQSGNMRNRKLNKNNKTGVLGVYWLESRSRWLAEIKAEGSRRYLGHHKALLDAVAARRSAESKYGYHPNHGRAA